MKIYIFFGIMTGIMTWTIGGLIGLGRGHTQNFSIIQANFGNSGKFFWEVQCQVAGLIGRFLKQLQAILKSHNQK